MVMKTRTEAAAERHAAVRARADRPSERRSSPDGGRGWASVRVSGLALRSKTDSNLLQFEGMASVTETPYTMFDFFGEYSEVMASGAFTQTLKREGLDVPLVIQHEDIRRIARTTNGTLQLSETDSGLQVLADLDPEDLDVQYIAPKLRSGLIDEMSFKFRINSGEWSPDWETYRITDVDIHRGDVAVVAYGANPATAGSGLRAAPAAPPKTGAALIHPDELRYHRF